MSLGFILVLNSYLLTVCFTLGGNRNPFDCENHGHLLPNYRSACCYPFPSSTLLPGSLPASKTHTCVLAPLAQPWPCGKPHCLMLISLRLLIPPLSSCQSPPTPCFSLGLCFTLLISLPAPPTLPTNPTHQSQGSSRLFCTVVLDSPRHS